MLLLVASRRKGEIVPGVSYRVLGHPVVVGGVYLLFLSNLFVHGLVIWEEPLQRLGAVLVGLADPGHDGVAASPQSLRPACRDRAAGRIAAAMRPRRWPSSRAGIARRPTCTCGVRTATGSPAPSVRIRDFASLLGLRVDLPAGLAPELRVWAHAISPDGTDEPLPAHVTVRDDRGTGDVELGADGTVTLRLEAAPCQVEMTLTRSSA